MINLFTIMRNQNNQFHVPPDQILWVEYN